MAPDGQVAARTVVAQSKKSETVVKAKTVLSLNKLFFISFLLE